jgi:hypothetical protein
MMFDNYKQSARWVLCAAILFVASNTAHAIEHDSGGDLGQAHTECHHCSAEQSAATPAAVINPAPSLAIASAENLVAVSVGAPTTSFQARAPPLS